MGRATLHPPDKILDAARRLVVTRGSRGATIAEIAREAGAPVGSLYHRFGSRGDLLARLWLRAAKRAQAACFEAAEGDDAREAVVRGALALHDFSVEHPEDAQLLIAHRRETLMGDVADADLARELEVLNRPLGEAFRRLARALYGSASPEAVERIVFMTSDLPLGALRRHLVGRTPFPPGLRERIEVAVRAVLDAETATRADGRV